MVAHRSTIARDPHRGRGGSRVGPGREQDRTITYTGVIQAKTAIELAAG
jgi:hypothetical protein